MPNVTDGMETVPTLPVMISVIISHDVALSALVSS